ncbi:hypothetical protein [Marinicella litoralis]|uniref:Uncharacterized protein n=1 Tax=Marinicella litoralis TaxID=644220 RepID=A0A4R6XLQ1_9GAMM|nr:hypothetical protein [Marinicella litoralis]TDR20562.1 hypothetical protein C8D91_1536 [Marinicella litoralis]
MKNLSVLFGLVFSMAIHASEKNDYVDVKINHDEANGQTILTCEPKQKIENMPEQWVKICNEIGQALLQEAKKNGKNVSLTAEPFGMGGRFAQTLSQDLPDGVVPTKITSGDLTIR